MAPLTINPKSLLSTLPFLTATLLLPNQVAAGPRYNYPQLAHGRRAQAEARPNKRQQFSDPAYDPMPAGSLTPETPGPTAAPVAATATSDSFASGTTYTMITPSPGADPIPITSQGQVVVSYVPQITLCAMSLVPPPGALKPSAGFYGYGPRYPPASGAIRPSGASGASGSGIYPSGHHPTAVGTGTGSGGVPTGVMPPYPYINQTGPAPGSYSAIDSCSTSLSPTQTTVCATTVMGFASAATISRCDQAVTFSSQYGYALSVPPGITNPATLPADAVQTLTTYWEAPWQALTDGLTPDEVIERVCSVAPGYGAGQRCVDIRQVWRTSTGTAVTTTTTDIDLTTTISGPSMVIIENVHMPITETMTVLSFRSSVVVEYSYETVYTESASAVGATATTSEPPAVEAGPTTGETPAATVVRKLR